MAAEPDGESPDEGSDTDQAAGDRPAQAVEKGTTAQHQGRWRSEVRLAVAVGSVVVVVAAGLAGWNSYGAWRCHQAQQQRELFLRVARESARDMTTISHTEVEADVQRILDLSMGRFHDEFAQRKQPFINHIRQEQSMSEGTVVEAGLESVGDNAARALVTVSVKLTKADSGEQKLDGFRLRIDLHRIGAGAKVSEVEYVS